MACPSFVIGSSLPSVGSASPAVDGIGCSPPSVVCHRGTLLNTNAHATPIHRRSFVDYGRSLSIGDCSPYGRPSADVGHHRTSVDRLFLPYFPRSTFVVAVCSSVSRRRWSSTTIERLPVCLTYIHCSTVRICFLTISFSTWIFSRRLNMSQVWGHTLGSFPPLLDRVIPPSIVIAYWVDRGFSPPFACRL